MGNPKAFGEALRARRLALGLTLREFCRRTGRDASNVSKLERGRLAPPAEPEKLEGYARDLELRPGSWERREFVELGQVCAGRVPESVMSDEDLVRNLPLLFRTCSGRRPTPRQLERLAETIRKA
jgi:transcriptional regulator with XRE-family HTH domain